MATVTLTVRPIRFIYLVSLVMMLFLFFGMGAGFLGILMAIDVEIPISGGKF